MDKIKSDEVQGTKEVENEEIMSVNIKLPKKNTFRKDLKCEKYDYVCKKQTTMNKHVNTKHTDQICKNSGLQWNLFNILPKNTIKRKDAVILKNKKDSIQIKKTKSSGFNYVN